MAQNTKPATRAKQSARRHPATPRRRAQAGAPPTAGPFTGARWTALRALTETFAAVTVNGCGSAEERAQITVFPVLAALVEMLDWWGSSVAERIASQAVVLSMVLRPPPSPPTPTPPTPPHHHPLIKASAEEHPVGELAALASTWRTMREAGGPPPLARLPLSALLLLGLTYAADSDPVGDMLEAVRTTVDGWEREGGELDGTRTIALGEIEMLTRRLDVVRELRTRELRTRERAAGGAS